MNNKGIFSKLICVLIGIVIGITGTLGCWYYKEVYKYNLLPTSKSDIKEFNSLDFWNKATYYYENDLNVFLDNYYSIYNTYSLYDYLENSLSKYYDEYGYDAVLCSGLKSKNAMAQAYCVEKCCDMIGDKKLNKNSLSEALNTVNIETDIKTDYESEKDCIDLAKNRLELAKHLFSDENSEQIYHNEKNNRSAWISNVFWGNRKIRVIDNGVYYSVEYKWGEETDKMDFISNNVLEICGKEDNLLNVITFTEKITLLDIDKMIYSYIEKNESSEESGGEITSKKTLSCDDSVLKAECKMYNYRTDKEEAWHLLIDVKKNEVIEFKK